MTSRNKVSAMTEEQYWSAVQERTREADGAFVFAVRTTHIYCRPSCPSRHPLRRNVEFFPLPEAAERAGYRACKRCKPRDLAAGDPAVERVRRACRVIETALEEGEDGAPGLEALAEEVGSSPFHLQRLFKRHLGISPRDYAQLGMTPATYKKGGKGARIGYTVADSPMGRVLVAGTERGICAVSLGE